MSYQCPKCGEDMNEFRSMCESCYSKTSSTVTNNVLASRQQTIQKKTDNQYFDDDHSIDFIAVELKKDISYLVDLGIKLDKGALAAKTGGLGWAGYEAFTGDWLSALVVGGISLLAGGLTNSYKRIKLMEMQQKWMDRLSDLNSEQLEYLMAGLQSKYPLLLRRFQNLLQAGQQQ